ncbi:glycosyltransferase WbuB [Paraburkholderia sp. GAS348]|uniref:glycosyltransferase WbuB n=1 Tax=Paraburkholderia sp. GAS348 TaxID=3035132 RepID=UPI003D20A97C
MKVLIYGINYAPELTGIGKYTAEMAESLATAGHAVRVVCAPPYYPEWRIAADFSGRRYCTEVKDDVRIWRAPVWVPVTPKGLKRLLHLGSFAVSSLPALARHLLWRPDSIICVAPSLLNAPTGWLMARLTGASAWLHIQDYEVDAAFDLGMLKGGRVKRAALAIERLLMRRFDVVSTISGKMCEHAVRKGVDETKVVHFPNWVDTTAIFPLSRLSEYRDKLNISRCATVVLYSGNMGAKQGLEILALAAAELADRKHIVFVFCGDGPSKADLVRRCSGLENCRFIPLQPVERLNELLNLADIHVLPQRSGVADLVMPSKLTGMLASGRAIVAMAHAGTELFKVVSPRGVVVPPEQVQPLATAIVALAADGGERARLGAAAREFAEAQLSRDAVISHFEAKLRSLRARRQNRAMEAQTSSPSERQRDVDSSSPTLGLERREHADLPRPAPGLGITASHTTSPSSPDSRTSSKWP